MIFFVSLLLNLASAEPVNPNLLQSTEVHTFEDVVMINGIQYRRIEYKSEVFYVRLLANSKTGQDLELMCKNDAPFIQQNLVQTERKITRRVSAFMEFLSTGCDEKKPGKFVYTAEELAKYMKLGVSINSPKSTTVTKLWWNPVVNMVGATVDF